MNRRVSPFVAKSAIVRVHWTTDMQMKLGMLCLVLVKRWSAGYVITGVMFCEPLCAPGKGLEFCSLVYICPEILCCVTYPR
jgi:hypothetical protein